MDNSPDLRATPIDQIKPFNDCFLVREVLPEPVSQSRKEQIEEAARKECSTHGKYRDWDHNFNSAHVYSLNDKIKSFERGAEWAFAQCDADIIRHQQNVDIKRYEDQLAAHKSALKVAVGALDRYNEYPDDIAGVALAKITEIMKGLG